MAMTFTESEFQQAKFFVCLSVANKLRISNPEFETPETLRRLISDADPVLGQALSTFLVAYNRWYRFHLDIDGSEEGKISSPAQAKRHVELVEARDATRDALLRALKSAGVP
jgi:hypothetical protein